MSKIKISPATLKQQVEEGWKLKPLAEHYGLPVAQMKKALQTLGLKIRKFQESKFEFEEEIEEQAQDFVPDVNEPISPANVLQETSSENYSVESFTEETTVEQEVSTEESW